MDIYQKIKEFYERVTTEKRIIGKSVFGRNIYAVKIGDGNPIGMAVYAIHGREYITAELACCHYLNGLYKNTGSLWLIPLCNPDGALLSQCGVSSIIGAENEKRLLEINGGGDFSLWKANGRGVDLNVNFDARWGKGEKNVREVGSENYIGAYPFSEPETQALKSFTLKINPNYTVSYHTKGEEIYWYFYQPMALCGRDKKLALTLSESTGYPLAYAKGSVGGYKDWCIQKLKIPSFTVEAGAETLTHPIGVEGLENIVARNRDALRDLAKEYTELWQKDLREKKNLCDKR